MSFLRTARTNLKWRSKELLKLRWADCSELIVMWIEQSTLCVRFTKYEGKTAFTILYSSILGYMFIFVYSQGCTHRFRVVPSRACVLRVCCRCHGNSRSRAGSGCRVCRGSMYCVCVVDVTGTQDPGLHRAVVCVVGLYCVCVVDVTGTQDPGLHRAVVCVVGLCTTCVL